jgi:hypothetical protein
MRSCPWKVTDNDSICNEDLSYLQITLPFEPRFKLYTNKQ